MLQIFNQNYEKILKKIPQSIIGGALKTGINFILMIYWFVILVGTYLMLS